LISSSAQISNKGGISAATAISVLADPANPDQHVTISNTSTATTTATISGIAFGIKSSQILDLTNSGNITATGAQGTPGIAVQADTADPAHGGIANVFNDGSIIANSLFFGVGIKATVTANVNNTNTISATGVGILARTVNVFNASTGTIGSTDTITADAAISANVAATVDSAGKISGTTFGILSGGTVNVVNRSTGTISGFIAIQANGPATIGVVDAIDNAGGILGGAGGAGIQSGGVTDVINRSTGTISGHIAIQAIGAGGINAANTIDNAGGILGGAVGILTDLANVANRSTGTVSGDIAIDVFGGTKIGNDGNILGGKLGITADTVDVTNTRTGTISGNIAIQALGTGGVGSTITTSGAIISTAGATGTAIKLSAAADTLTLLAGSHIVGIVDMGDVAKVGNDTVNVTAVAPSSKVSSLTTAAELPTLVNFHGKLNTTFSGGGFNGPTVQAGNQLATLDPRAGADRPHPDGFHRRGVVTGAGPSQRRVALFQRRDDGDELRAGDRQRRALCQATRQERRLAEPRADHGVVFKLWRPAHPGRDGFHIARDVHRMGQRDRHRPQDAAGLAGRRLHRRWPRRAVGRSLLAEGRHRLRVRRRL
jgi:hypothetical protein